MKNNIKRIIFTLVLITNLFLSSQVFGEDLSSSLDTPTCVLPQVINEETGLCIDPEEETESTLIHLQISDLYNSDIEVLPCDSDNNPATEDIATPYCAILQSGVSSDWDWSWAPGAFVTAIEGIEGFTSVDSQGNNIYHYWSWSLNGDEAMIGLNQYELQSGDSVLLEFIDPTPEVEEVDEDPAPRSRSGSSGSYITPQEEKTFSIPLALEFLSSQQKDNGSFGDILYTDWVAVGISKTEADIMKNKVKDFLLNYKYESNVITDNERHAMALMALGINPYTETGINYIKKITDSFDGNQIGETSAFNDDIFALIILNKAGYTKEDKIIKKIIPFIISKQSQDGSWGSVDMTAAALSALENFKDIETVEDSIKKGEVYLLSKQKENGSFDNSFSTSWTIQALEKDPSFSLEVNKAVDYLSLEQQEDGGIEKENKIENRIWATAYTIPAVARLSWNDTLQPFEKKEEVLKKEEQSMGNLPVKITKNKEIEDKKEVELSPREESSGNPLEASALGAVKGENVNNPFLQRLINKIKFPSWLFWINLIF